MCTTAAAANRLPGKTVSTIWPISKSTFHGVCNGNETLALGWANTGQEHACDHVQRLPCSEVLQSRSPKDGFEKSRTGRESDDGAAPAPGSKDAEGAPEA